MTAVSIRWLGHSTFWIDLDGKTILTDPFLSGNPFAAVKADDLTPDTICVSHGHGDHVGDLIGIATRTGCKVTANVEIARWAVKQGVGQPNAVGVNTGGTYNLGFAKVKYTIAFHSSSLPDGTYGGMPHGYIITAPDGRKIYFAGDTALFGDMRLYGDEGIDVAILPIGDHFTMGVDDSIRAVKLLSPRVVIPMHFNTFPPIAQDGAAWAERVRTETQATPVVLSPGETYTL
ncbi:MAG: metal-dependent hydrolase [Anaerolineae bacterium]|jgi:L-ascorbate metabolism protein UlaG (beta-lactamase superfamily)|nr:metal-dependent hydrolase [Anaerolineae bacterium]